MCEVNVTLLWICCTTYCATNPQQIEVMEFWLYVVSVNIVAVCSVLLHSAAVQYALITD